MSNKGYNNRLHIPQPVAQVTPAPKKVILMHPFPKQQQQLNVMTPAVITRIRRKKGYTGKNVVRLQ